MTRGALPGCLVAALLALLALAGCGGVQRIPTATLRTTGAPAADPRGTVTMAPADRPRLALPLRRAVAQLFVVGFPGTDATTAFAARLRDRDWGGILLQAGNRAAGAPGSAAEALVGALKGVAKGAHHTAPFVAAGPDMGTGVAAMRSLGVTLALAPSADLGYVAGPDADAAFGEDPRAAASDTSRDVARLRRARIVSAVGHFPGEGGASQDPDAGTATVGLDLPGLRAADEVPFAAVVHRVPAVQMSNAVYAAWDGVTPASLLPEAIAELRTRLGFGGVIVSGDLGAAQEVDGGSIGSVAVAALRAGDDLLLLPGDATAQDQAYRAVVKAVIDGKLPVARIAQSLDRVLALKRAYGIR